MSISGGFDVGSGKKHQLGWPRECWWESGRQRPVGWLYEGGKLGSALQC